MTKKERAEYDTIAKNGCCICGAPCEIHHVRRLGQRRDNAPAIGLCPAHHRTGGYGVAIHAGRKAWEDNFGQEESFINGEDADG